MSMISLTRKRKMSFGTFPDFSIIDLDNELVFFALDYWWAYDEEERQHMLGSRRRRPLTTGQEIEQWGDRTVYVVPDHVYRERIKERKLTQGEISDIIRSEASTTSFHNYGRMLESLGIIKEFEKDGSCPWEFSSRAYSLPSSVLNWFLNVSWIANHPALREQGNHYIWRWAQRNCGCHVHIRPYFKAYGVDYGNPPIVADEATIRKAVEMYTIMYNTAVDVLTFMLPFFCVTASFRPTACQWSSPTSSRKSEATVYSRYVEPYEIHNDWGLHPYSFVCFNRKKRDKPLTIEIRCVEAHPAFAMAGISFFSKIMKHIYDMWLGGERDVSVKAESASKFQNRDIYDVILWIQRDALCNNRNIYELYTEYGPIKFERPIPLDALRKGGEYKKEFRNALEVFQWILYDELRWLRRYPDIPLRWYIRVAYLLYYAGNLRQNDLVVWNILDKNFAWDRPRIDMSPGSHRRLKLYRPDGEIHYYEEEERPAVGVEEQREVTTPSIVSPYERPPQQDVTELVDRIAQRLPEWAVGFVILFPDILGRSVLDKTPIYPIARSRYHRAYYFSPYWRQLDYLEQNENEVYRPAPRCMIWVATMPDRLIPCAVVGYGTYRTVIPLIEDIIRRNGWGYFCGLPEIEGDVVRRIVTDYGFVVDNRVIQSILRESHIEDAFRIYTTNLLTINALLAQNSRIVFDNREYGLAEPVNQGRGFASAILGDYVYIRSDEVRTIAMEEASQYFGVNGFVFGMGNTYWGSRRFLMESNSFVRVDALSEQVRRHIERHRTQVIYGPE